MLALSLLDRIEAKLEHWYVTGLRQQDIVPSLVASIGDTASSLLKIEFETNPENSPADQTLIVQSQPVEVIYDAVSAGRAGLLKLPLGLGVGLVCKCSCECVCCANMRCRVWILSIQVKDWHGHACACKQHCLRCWRIAGTCWLPTMFSEKPCLQGLMQRVRNRIACSPLASARVHECTHLHVYMIICYTCVHFIHKNTF